MSTKNIRLEVMQALEPQVEGFMDSLLNQRIYGSLRIFYQILKKIHFYKK